MRTFVSFFIFLLLIAFSAPHAQAISVSPAVIDVRVAASERNDFSFLVTNDENETISYAFSIQKFVSRGDSGQPNFLPPSDTSGLPDWLFLDAPSITLRPGESKIIPVSLRVPNDAASGGHYAAIFLTQTTLNSATGLNVTAIPRIGVLVFVTVDGALLQKAQVNNIFVFQPDNDRLPVYFDISIENQGNIHFAPTIEIEVSDMFGRPSAYLKGNPDNAKILPGSKRDFRTAWLHNPEDTGTGFMFALQQEWRNWGLGVYKARVNTYIDSRLVNNQVIAFSIWPWRTLTISFSTIFFVFLLFLSIYKKRR